MQYNIILCWGSDISNINHKRLVMLSCDSIIIYTYTQVPARVILVKCVKVVKVKSFNKIAVHYKIISCISIIYYYFIQNNECCLQNRNP